MNNQYSDILSELNRKKIQDEMAAIHLEEKATKGKSLSSRSLATLGKWMVTTGEKLRSQNDASSETTSENIFRSQVRKVGA